MFHFSMMNSNTNYEYDLPDERPTCGSGNIISMVREEYSTTTTTTAINNKPLSFQLLYKQRIVRYLCYGAFGLSFLVASLVFGYAISYWSHTNKNNDNNLDSSKTNHNPHWPEEEFQNRYRFFRSYIGNWSDEVVLWQSHTPQAQALEWLVYQDQTINHITMANELKLSTKHDNTTTFFLTNLANRYAILILYFSSGGASNGGTTFVSSTTTTATTGVSPPSPESNNCDPTLATCEWSMVTCETPDVIVALKMHNALNGPLPMELSLLSTLTNLDLSSNELKGTIPGDIFTSLTNLESLNLSSNQLAGSIPSEFGLLSQLTQLDVSQNYLQGPIPLALQNLTQLQVVYFSFNQQLNTTSSLFDDFFPHWQQLQIFHCHQTQFTGEIKNLPPTLQELDISSSPITGSLANLPLMPHLTHLTVTNNDLHGALPPFLHIPNIEVFAFQASTFTGTIASDIGTLTNLEQLEIILTQIHGTIPSEIGHCTKLQALHLSSNDLTGTIPSEIGNLVNLRSMSVDKNRDLQGSVPTTLCQALQTSRLLLIRDCNLPCECCLEMCMA